MHGMLEQVKAYAHPDLRDVTLPAVMQALSDPCRIAIVRELLQANGRALACNEVRLKISKATRSHHFEVLRAAGLVHTETEGTKCRTSLRRKELNQHFPGLLKLLAGARAQSD
jgi:DNA-binding transcriptional ArsR family regulator